MLEENPNQNDKEAELELLIDDFGEKNEIIKSLKKEIEPKNAKIKELMVELSKDKVNTKSFTATYVVKHSSSIDEEKLLRVLSEDRVYSELLGLIKTKEYVDMDALEDALYHNKFDENTLEKIGSCKVDKETATLTVRGRKK